MKAKTDFTGINNVRATLDVASSDFAAPTVHVSGVAAYQGWHAGYQVSIINNVMKMKGK